MPAAPPDTASPVPQSFLCLSLPQFWPSYAQRYKAKEAMSVCTRNTCRMQSQHFPFRGTFSFCPRALAGSQQYQAMGCCWIPRTDCNMDRAEQGLMCTKDNCQDLFFFFFKIMSACTASFPDNHNKSQPLPISSQCN